MLGGNDAQIGTSTLSQCRSINDPPRQGGEIGVQFALATKAPQNGIAARITHQNERDDGQSGDPELGQQ